MKGLSIREFARRDGCSDTLVHRALKQGRLIAYDDGSIDPALVGTPWRRGVAKPVQAAAEPATASVSFAEAQRRKENYLALLRQLEFEVKSGRLVDAEAASKQAFELARAFRDSLLNWPARVAPLIAAELGIEQNALSVVLDQHVNRFLAEQASAGETRNES